MFRSVMGGIAALSISAAPVFANCYEDTMIVFDASGSMGQTYGSDRGLPRIVEAQSAMREVMPLVPPDRNVGLMTYGPGGAGFCNNIQLRLEPEPYQTDAILNVLDTLQPMGDTPLGRAVEQAAEVLSYETQPATVVVVTDGADNCSGSVCRIAERLAAEGADTTVHVIGFRLQMPDEGQNPYASAPGCLAAATGGSSVVVHTAIDLEAALRETLTCPLVADLGDMALPRVN